MIKLGRLIAVFVIAATVVLVPTAWAQQVLKIGVFDAQRLSQETVEGSKLQARLTALQQRKREELKKLSEEIERLNTEFQQTSTSLSADKSKELALRIERKQIELDGAQKSATREVTVEVEQAQEGWQKRVLDAVTSYGKEKGFSIILPVEVIGYASASLDITSDLAAMIDKLAAPAPAAAAPAPAPPKK